MLPAVVRRLPGWLGLVVLVAIAASASPVSSTPLPDDPAPITLAAVGDIMLARSIGAGMERNPKQSPFAAVEQVLQNADVTVGNLECALGTRGKAAPKAYTFRGPAIATTHLANAGFDVLALANNHSLDYGVAGLNETMRLLDDVAIQHPGAGANATEAHRPVIHSIRDTKLAFLSYVDVPKERGGFVTASWRAGPNKAGVAWAEPAQISADVAAAKHNADLVIVLLHSGYEGIETPNAIQRAAARAAIDGGASLVIGSHPHTLQGVEYYGNGVIAYSLGNFVFDGQFKQPETAILQVALSAKGVESISWVPVVIKQGLPQRANKTEGQAILKRIDQLSARLRNK